MIRNACFWGRSRPRPRLRPTSLHANDSNNTNNNNDTTTTTNNNNNDTTNSRSVPRIAFDVSLISLLRFCIILELHGTERESRDSRAQHAIPCFVTRGPWGLEFNTFELIVIRLNLIISNNVESNVILVK